MIQKVEVNKGSADSTILVKKGDQIYVGRSNGDIVGIREVHNTGFSREEWPKLKVVKEREKK